MVNVPRLQQRATDSVSRHPTGDPVKMTLIDDIADIPVDKTKGDTIDHDIIDCYLIAEALILSSLNALPLTSVTWERLKNF